MFIISCDFHLRLKQIAMLDPTTSEIIKRRLEHENGEAKAFYAKHPDPARVGMEATCDAQWLKDCCKNIITNCGSETRRRSVPLWCASRRRTSAMPGIFSISWFESCPVHQRFCSPYQGKCIQASIHAAY